MAGMSCSEAFVVGLGLVLSDSWEVEEVGSGLDWLCQEVEASSGVISVFKRTLKGSHHKKRNGTYIIV